MEATWQIILGDVLSIVTFSFFLFSAIFLIEDIRVDVALFCGWLLSLAIPAFVIGDVGFTFSNIVLKNIFLVALLESLMIVLIILLVLIGGAILSNSHYDETKDRGALILFATLISCILIFTVVMGINFCGVIEDKTIIDKVGTASVISAMHV